MSSPRIEEPFVVDPGTLGPAHADQRIAGLTLKAGQPYTFKLEPFEVLVFDAAAEGQ